MEDARTPTSSGRLLALYSPDALDRQHFGLFSLGKIYSEAVLTNLTELHFHDEAMLVRECLRE